MVKKILKRIKRGKKSILSANPYLLHEKEKGLVKKSFYFPGSNGRAVLLLHGWSTTPYELRRLGGFLNEAGYTVYGPLLSGHGTVYTDLENVRYEDWLRDAELAFEKLKKEHQKVFVGGTSMGANIALCLAKEKGEISGVILMATPYKIKFEKVSGLFAKFLSGFKKYHRKFYPPTFGSSTTITRLISYQKYPLKNLLELGELVKKSRENLHLVKQPCLLLQSKHDHIITKNSLDKLYEKIGSKNKKKKYIEKAYHTFISDIRNEHIFEDILNFLSENK